MEGLLSSIMARTGAGEDGLRQDITILHQISLEIGCGTLTLMLERAYPPCAESFRAAFHADNERAVAAMSDDEIVSEVAQLLRDAFVEDAVYQ